jgi:hypothetical protein
MPKRGVLSSIDEVKNSILKLTSKEKLLLSHSYPRQIGKEVNGMSENIKMQRCNPE